MYNPRVVYGKTLKGIPTKVRFTREALWECEENVVIPDVAADLVREAADYILGKQEDERFTIACDLPSIVISGFVIYKDDEEIELLITNVYGDISFVKKGDYFKVD